MIRKILSLCARGTSHPDMLSRLQQTLLRFEAKAETGSWNRLLHEAEQQGLAPLLHHHSRQIDFQFPENFRLPLLSLYLRTKQANIVRNQAFAEILSLYEASDIAVLAIKGIALCNFLYQKPGLRPMRDIDLLVGEKDLAAAQEILFDLEYRQALQHDIPANYYHLPYGKNN